MKRANSSLLVLLSLVTSLGLVAPSFAQTDMLKAKVELKKEFREEVKEMRENLIEKTKELKKEMKRPVSAGLRGTITTLPSTSTPTSFTFTVISNSSTTLETNGVIKPANGTLITVAVANDTKLVRKFDGVSALSEFNVGDEIIVKGTFSSSTALSASWIRNESIREQNKNGIVSAIDSANQTVTLNWTNQNIVKIIPTTAITLANNASGTFSNLQIGQQVSVKGVLNTRTSIWTAKKITVKGQTTFPFTVTLNGKLLSTPSSTLPTTLQLNAGAIKTGAKNMPLNWREFMNKQNVSVTVDAATTLYDKSWNKITVASLLANDKLSIGAKVQENGTILATFLQVTSR